MHVGQQRGAVWKRSLFKFNRNKQNRSVKGSREHPGSLAETNSPPGPGFTGAALSPPVRSSLKTFFFFFLHPFCKWPPDWALGPSPSFNWKQTTLMSKQLLNYFLPQQGQNIKHVLNGCPIPWRNFMISLLLHSMFGCLAEVALSPCQTMKQHYY